MRGKEPGKGIDGVGMPVSANAAPLHIPHAFGESQASRTSSHIFCVRLMCGVCCRFLDTFPIHTQELLSFRCHRIELKRPLDTTSPVLHFVVGIDGVHADRTLKPPRFVHQYIQQAWQTYMLSKNVTTTDVEESSRLLDLNVVRNNPERIVAALDSLQVDHIAALAVSYLFEHSSRTI